MMPGRSGHRCAADAKPEVAAMFSRRMTAAIFTYLSGRIGAINPARRIVATRPNVSVTRSSADIGSAEDRESALPAQSVQRPLHYLAHMRVNRGDVWVLTELGDDVDRFENLRNDL